MPSLHFRWLGALILAFQLASAPTVLAQQSVTTRLQPLGDSRAGGTARVAADDGGTRVSLQLTGLTPGTRYVAQVQAGTCFQPSASFATLATLDADAAGQATASQPVLFRAAEPIRLGTLADGDHIITISLAGQNVACGVIPGLTGEAPAQLPARLPDTGEAVFDRTVHWVAALGTIMLGGGLVIGRRRAR